MTSVYEESDKGNLNVDLVDEFVRNGCVVDVLTPRERKYGGSFEITEHDGLRVIRFPCLNFRGKVNLIEKGLSTLSLGYQYRHTLRKHLSEVDYDLAVYTTLPITYGPALRLLKHKSGAFCYLLQKDFFPQSAVDLGLLVRRSPAYRLFRRIEAGLYEASDAIGVMSPKNAAYLLEHEPRLDSHKVEVCPNSIRPFGAAEVAALKMQRQQVRNLYGIPQDAVVYMYGGNISRAQGIDQIVAIVESFGTCSGSYLLFVGGGQEAARLRAVVEQSVNVNVGFLDHLPKAEFDRVLAACDVGLVFLDPRFTIANIPSRTLAHMNMSQPIVAATDDFTDFRDIVEGSSVGLWGHSEDLNTFLANVNKLTSDSELRQKLGRSARSYLEKRCSVQESYGVIMNRLAGYACAARTGAVGMRSVNQTPIEQRIEVGND